MDWFSGWHWAIVAVIFLLLFGSTRLPGAAKSLGSSLHIFKKSYKEGMDEAQAPAPIQQPPAQQYLPPSPPVGQPAADDATQAQLRDLQRQLDEMRQNAASAPSADAPGDQRTS